MRFEFFEKFSSVFIRVRDEEIGVWGLLCFVLGRLFVFIGILGFRVKIVRLLSFVVFLRGGEGCRERGYRF